MKKRYQGDGFDVTEEDGIYRMSWEQGPFGIIKEYEISKENFEKAMKSSKDAYEVSVYAQTGSWPSSEEEKLEEARKLIRRLPKPGRTGGAVKESRPPVTAHKEISDAKKNSSPHYSPFLYALRLCRKGAVQQRFRSD